MTEPADIVRAATIGRRAPIGRIRYAAERITAVLERGADPAVNLLAVRTILEGVADEFQAAPGAVTAEPNASWAVVGESPGCGFPPVQPRKAAPAVQQQAREMFGPGSEGYRDYLLAKYPVTLEELDAEPDPSLPPNMEDCPQCTDPNPPYPFICPGHPTAAGPEEDGGGDR